MSYITVDVDIDDIADQIDDETIKEIYIERNLGEGAENWDEQTELEKAYMLEWQGNRAEAFEILWKMCLIKLNKVV